nr:MAG TPA: hypothetical protein [Caudoviricetes sp.]
MIYFKSLSKRLSKVIMKFVKSAWCNFSDYCLYYKIYTVWDYCRRSL